MLLKLNFSSLFPQFFKEPTEEQLIKKASKKLRFFKSYLHLQHTQTDYHHAKEMANCATVSLHKIINLPTGTRKEKLLKIIDIIDNMNKNKK